MKSFPATATGILLILLINAVTAQEAPKIKPTEPTRPTKAVKKYKAVINKVTGRAVQVNLDGKKWQVAKKDMQLPAKAQVRTGFGSSCELVFGKHTIVQVKPVSSIKLSEYSGTGKKQKVQTNLQYGAVRCGVEHGGVEADTSIRTPVSTLSIRGTWAEVEYDRGLDRDRHYVSEGGPVVVRSNSHGFTGSTGKRQYTLNAGKRTTNTMIRSLTIAISGRTIFTGGNPFIGGATRNEARTTFFQGGIMTPAGPTNSGVGPTQRRNSLGGGDYDIINFH